MRRIIGVFALVLVATYGFYAIVTASTDGGKAQRGAESMGYKDVRVVHKGVAWPFSGCGRSDTTIVTVQGTDAQGVKHIFAFCQGVWKGATLRSM